MKELLLLKNAIETAKIEASRNARAPLVGCQFEDASGDEVDVEALGIELTQQEVARIAEPIIAKSITLVKKVLAAKNDPQTGFNNIWVLDIASGKATAAPFSLRKPRSRRRPRAARMRPCRPDALRRGPPTRPRCPHKSRSPPRITSGLRA